MSDLFDAFVSNLIIYQGNKKTPNINSTDTGNSTQGTRGFGHFQFSVKDHYKLI